MLLLRIGQLKKGWITGKISAEWIKQFDELTHKKVSGQPQLLLVDRHCSHYTYISKTSKYYIVLLVLAEYYFIAGLLSESPIHNRYN